MTPEQVLAVAEAGRRAGCKEALCSIGGDGVSQNSFSRYARRDRYRRPNPGAGSRSRQVHSFLVRFRDWHLPTSNTRKMGLRWSLSQPDIAVRI